MARLLNDNMSSSTHISNAKRHVNLCRRTKGADQLVEKILPKIELLKSKKEATETQKDVRDEAFDNVVYFDAELDDTIRTIADDTKVFDRKNTGIPVYNILFPTGKYSDIVRAPFTKEIGLATQLAERIISLGESHQLYSHVEILKNSVTRLKSSIDTLEAEDLKVKTAIAQEELAQAELRMQYEHNFLDAVKVFGKKFANRLFPKSMPRAKKEETETPVEE